MGSITTTDARFAQFISIEKLHPVNAYDTHAKITLIVPWPVAEQLAAFAAPFLNAVKDSIDLRTVKVAEMEDNNARSRLHYEKRQSQNRAVVLGALKRIYREGIDYWQFCKAIERPFFVIHNADRHKLYHDARARMCERMLRAGKKDAEIAAFFGLASISSIKKRLH